MTDDRIVYSPAECHVECEDWGCPYHHCDAWIIGEAVFYTLAEAEQHLAECNATLVILQEKLDEAPR